MSFNVRPILAGVLCTLLTTTSALALEPDPPSALISPEEAMSITIRQRLSEIPKKLPRMELEEREGLAKFYARDNARPVWVDANGVKPQARIAVTEIRNAPQWGLSLAEFDLPTDGELARKDFTIRERIDLELRISTAVVRYARYASGGHYDPTDLSNSIDRQPEVPEPSAVIKTVLAAADPAAALRQYQPQQEQFKRLQRAYLLALEEEKNPGLRDEDADEEKKKSRRSQKKGSKTKLSQRILYNMEMWRWMPRNLGEMYIQANIPEYRFRIVSGGKVIHQERIITGKVEHQTPIFSDEMERIIINPNWNVPNSIKIKELLPGLLQGKDTIGRQGLVVEDSYGRRVDPYSVDWSRTDIRNFRVYQPPSARNALGVVKFLFPNKHSVYMHDTPSKYLFKREKRAYSHGCMRVRDPLQFAALILGRDKGWSMDKIKSIVRRGQNTPVELDTRIPVHVTYFTVTVDDQGEITQYPDVYSFERLVQTGLDGKAHLIVKPKKNLSADLQRITQVHGDRNADGYGDQDTGSFFYSGRRRGSNPEWMRRIWGWD
jgi:murein L,D-transpeptidase YcbB/YkuD